MLLFTVLLRVLHFGYSVILRLHYLWQQRSSQEPLPLQTPRRQIPRHLAILFVVDPKSDTEATQNALTESTLRAVSWSRTIGVKKLTVYEENGLLSHCADDIQSALPIKHSNFSEPEDEYQPPTPPLSDYADSLPLPSCHPPNFSSRIATLVIAEQPPHEYENWPRKRRLSHSGPTSSKDELLLCLISRSSSKPAIASAAQALGAMRTPRSRRNSRSQKVTDFGLTVDQLNRVLEDESGLSSPDFMIIHPLSPSSRITPPELHGFPPWHIRLTEIFQNHSKSLGYRIWRAERSSPPNVSILDESTFRRALDEFSSAEMRFGK